MEESLRRGSRSRKVKRDPDFIYEESSCSILLNSNNRKPENRTQCPTDITSDSSDSSSSDLFLESKSDTVQSIAVNEVINNLPELVISSVNSEFYDISGCIAQNYLSQSLTEQANDLIGQSSESECVQNNNKVKRAGSSTLGDFLDLQGNYLSVSDMSLINDEAGATALPLTCKVCCSELASESEQCITCASANDHPLGRIMLRALGQIGGLKSDVNAVGRILQNQSERLSRLELNSANSGLSGLESGSEPIFSHQRQGVKSKLKHKVNRVESEKYRQLPVVKENLRRQEKSKTATESEYEDEERRNRDLERNLSKSQQEEVDRKLAASLERAGGVFPEYEVDPSSDTSSSSGKETSESESDLGRSKKKKKKIKSGAEIKTRPVKKRETWPHTIINEDEGVEITSQDISLSKFFTAFTYLM